MKTRVKVFCCRCEANYFTADQTTDAACQYCGFAHVVSITTAGNTGTQRTADSAGDASGATSITVT